MTDGVSKSGSPNSRWITSAPSRSRACARWNTSTARKGSISCARRAIIRASPAPRARGSDLRHHARPTFEPPPLGAGLIGPVPRPPADRVAPAPRAQDQLAVEAEAVGARGAEERVPPPAPKELEPALGVHDLP